MSYNLLLEEVRKRLGELGEKNGRFYGLTAALPCGTNHIDNIDVAVAAGYMSELNLMTYGKSIVIFGIVLRSNVNDS